MVIPRTPLFATVGEIVVIDPHKIEFRMTEPRPKAYMLGAFASGWNIIVRKKTLDDNGGNLRQVMNYPGTGPFKHVSRKDKEIWIRSATPTTGTRGCRPSTSSRSTTCLPFSPELGASILAGKVDYARLLDPVSWRKAKEMQGVTAGVFNQSVIQAFWTNMQKNKALADPKVRRAIHLAMDRHTLVEVVKDTAPMQVGGFVYPFHEMSTPRAELEKKLGYQKDTKPAVQEAQRLMKEAGYANGLKNLDFVVRDIADLQAVGGGDPGHAEGKPQHRVQSPRGADLGLVRRGRRRATSTWPSARSSPRLMDPSDIFSAWYGKDGPQNYSRWTNPAFHDLASQIERELDDTKRKAMVRKAEDMLEMRSAAHPDLVRADLRRLVQQGAGPEPLHVLRHLRRRPVGQRLAVL